MAPQGSGSICSRTIPPVLIALLDVYLVTARIAQVEAAGRLVHVLQFACNRRALGLHHGVNSVYVTDAQVCVPAAERVHAGPPSSIMEWIAAVSCRMLT
jgi:hypothetical protein